MSDHTKKPNIPEPNDPRFGETVRETIEVGEGLRGDPLDRKMTLRDAVRAGLVEVKEGASGDLLRQGAGLQPTGSGPGGEEGGGGEDGDDGDDGCDFPKPPDDLEARGAFSDIVVYWAVPTYRCHSYTEVARSDAANFGESDIIGKESGSIYVDSVGGGQTYYYWARNVSQTGLKSSWEGPVKAETAIDPDHLLTQFTNEAVNRPLYGDFQDQVTEDIQKQYSVKVGATADGQTVVGGIGLQAYGPEDTDNPGGEDAFVEMGIMANSFWIANPSVDYTKDDKVFPFIIDDEGRVIIDTAYIAEATIKDAQIETVATDTIVAGDALLNSAQIDVAEMATALVSNTIQSINYEPNKHGWILRKESAELNDVKVRGLLHNGSLDPNGDPAGDARYIDFRSGVSNGEGGTTNGDFVLGDVGTGEYISYKYEQDAGKKILRVRGDILYKEFNPGNTVYFENNLNSTVGNISNCKFFDPYAFWWDRNEYDCITQKLYVERADQGAGTWYVDANGYHDLISTFFGVTRRYVFATAYDGYSLIKSTYVYGAGKIRVKANGVSRPEIVWSQNSALRAAYNIPIVGLGIIKRDGSLTVYHARMKYQKRANDQEWTYINGASDSQGKAVDNFWWSFDENITVELGEQIVIVAVCFTHEQNETSNTAEAIPRQFSAFNGGEVECNNMTLLVDDPYETYARK